jgi:hypothetical protein
MFGFLHPWVMESTISLSKRKEKPGIRQSRVSLTTHICIVTKSRIPPHSLASSCFITHKNLTGNSFPEKSFSHPWPVLTLWKVSYDSIWILQSLQLTKFSLWHFISQYISRGSKKNIQKRGILFCIFRYVERVRGMEYESNAYKTVGRQPELGDYLEILQVKCRLISIIYITKDKEGGTLIKYVWIMSYS